MRRFVMITALLGVAVSFSLAAPMPADAGGKSAKKYRGKTTTHVIRRGLFGRRYVTVRKPRVRGFTARVGGYSFNVGKSYDYDPFSPPPRDFGPQHDVTPPRLGIIPTRPYP